MGFDGNEDFHVDATKFLNTGTLRITRGARLHWAGDATIAAIADAGGTFLPTGRTLVTGPVRGPGLFVQGTADSVTRFASGVDLPQVLNVVSGTVELGGTTRLSGPRQTLFAGGDGSIILLSGARLELTADDGESFAGVQGSGRFVNRGTIVRDGGGAQTLGPATFVNEGTLSVVRGALADAGQRSTFTNRGVITVASDTTLLHDQVDLVQESGEMRVDGLTTFDDVRIEGGTLRGSGVIRTAGGTGHLENAGTIAPGNSPGTLTVDRDYVQRAGGRVVMDLLGNDSDQFVVSGDASFAGLLEIAFAPGFVPTLGERIGLIFYRSHSGTLALVPTSDAARAGYAYDLAFETDGAWLTVTGLAPPVPEPASFVLLAAGLGLVGAAWRRRTSGG